MRQAHIGGDKLFVDYAGDTVPVIVDRLTGQVHPAQIFVAVMGASNFTYAEASWTQALADWIGAHTRAFAAIGGVPKLLVPDNTKVAVIKACLYEPQVNRTYADLARHYGTAIVPARPYKPRDKAKVEVGVQVVARWILGHQPFYATCLRSTAQIAATLTPAPGPLDGVITITGIGDHLRLEWPITITGMRKRAAAMGSSSSNSMGLRRSRMCHSTWQASMHRKT